MPLALEALYPHSPRKRSQSNRLILCEDYVIITSIQEDGA
jgi:hypothetical protein